MDSSAQQTGGMDTAPQSSPMQSSAPPMDSKGGMGGGMISGFSQEMKYMPVPQAEVLPVMTSYPQQQLLNFEIRDRPAFAHVEVTLQPGQFVLGNGREMLWMDFPDDGANLSSKVRTHCAGGCCKSCYRTCAGESACQNTFGPGPGKVTFGCKLPGDMLPFGVLPNEGWMVSPGAFVAGTDNIEVSAQFAGCFACCCGGMMSPWLVRITVNPNSQQAGVFWGAGYGALTRHELQQGQTLYVDTGLFFAASDKSTIDPGCVGGCITWTCGGEGIVMKFTGPQVIYTQNRSPSTWKEVLAPKKHKKKKGPADAAASLQGGGVQVSVQT